MSGLLLFTWNVGKEEGGDSARQGREYSLVQRLFALCNISTRLTKGMRANDTQFLLCFERLSMSSQIVAYATIPIFSFTLSYNQIDADFPTFDVRTEILSAHPLRRPSASLHLRSG